VFWAGLEAFAIVCIAAFFHDYHRDVVITGGMNETVGRGRERNTILHERRRIIVTEIKW
jgi:predicted ATPase